MNVGFILSSIENNQFAFDELDIAVQDRNKIKVGLKTSFGVDVEHHVVACIMNVNFSYQNNKIVFLETECHFDLAQKLWEEFISPDKNLIVLPVNLLQHLGVITYGTMRGILFEKLQGSVFEFLQLPLMNLTQSIKEDMEFSLD